MPDKTGLISLGVFIVIVAVSILVYSFELITMLETLPLMVGFYGCWMIILAGMRYKNPSSYARGPLSTFAWGLLLAVTGFSVIASWRVGLNLLYVVAAVLLVIGILVIAVAVERKT